MPARLDSQVPIEDTVGVIAEMIKAGYVRAWDCRKWGRRRSAASHAVHPIADLQIEYSVITRGPEAKIFPILKELGIGVTAYGVLSRGLLSGSKVLKNDARAFFPRFSGDNLARNQRLIHALNGLASEKGISGTQLAIAWVLARSSNIVPVMGARTVAQLEESLGALDVTMSADDLRRIEEAVPASEVAGTRYAAPQMAHLDSEK